MIDAIATMVGRRVGTAALLRTARLTVIATITAASLFASPAAMADPIADALFAKSQALLDAVAPGDQKVWEATLAEDGMFTDEEGTVRSKAQLVAEIRPLPPGVTGRMSIEKRHIAHTDTLAVLSYEAVETEMEYGQTLVSHYHITEIYRLGSAGWQLFASQAVILPSEATPTGKPAPLADFAGTYALGDRISASVTVEADSLVAVRGDQRDVLIALGGDYFARKGRPRALRIFIRDPNGKVVGFVDRRDNVDLRWMRK